MRPVEPLRRITSRAARSAMAAILLLQAIASIADGSSASADSPPPPPLEPVEVEHEVPVPPGVVIDNITNAGHLLPDEEHILVKTYVDGKSHFSTWRIDDGSELECITCDLLPEASLGDAFEDGSRILVTAGSSDAGGTGDAQYRVVECTPSIVDCESKLALPVRFPKAGLSQGVQNREARIHPDGEHLKWNEVSAFDGLKMTIGRLERRDTEYVVTEPVVVNPPYATGGSTGGWVDGGRFYELGDWIDGGRKIKYGATTTGLNYDVWELDLVTGSRRQVTTDLDYNELYTPSPDGSTVAYASARGLDRMDLFTQLVRPSFLDAAAFPAVGRISLYNNRRCMNEQWLMDRQGQRGTYGGQPVVLEDDWVIRSWSWFADGTRALVFEESLAETPSGSPERRIRVLRFPNREPRAPLPVTDLDDLDLSWAFPYGSYQGLSGRSFLSFVPGPKGGGALVFRFGIFGVGIWLDAYFDYVDTGSRIISGSESVTGSALSSTTWSAALTVGGASHGFLRGRLSVGGVSGGGQAPFSGFVSSEVDGVRFEDVPVQSDCPGVGQPPLSFGTLTTGTDTVEVTVEAHVPEDPVARPVSGASVEVTLAGGGTVSASTDDDGRATLLLPPASDPVDPVWVRAEAGSFRPVEAAL